MDTNKLTTSQLILIMFIMIAIINGLMSCSSSKIVYDNGKEWAPMNNKSSVTNWKYK